VAPVVPITKAKVSDMFACPIAAAAAAGVRGRGT